VTIIPEQRDSNENAARNFSADLWATFATIERGGIRWSENAPLPADWFTNDTAADLDRATDLLCEADTALIDASMSGNPAACEQAAAHCLALSDLCDFLASVVETAAQVQA
jgi:hypothetical protein